MNNKDLEKINRMEKYCLNDELEFLHSLFVGNLREKIEKRIGHLKARLKPLEINSQSNENTERRLRDDNRN